MTVQWAGGGNGPGHRKSAFAARRGKGFLFRICLGDFCLLLAAPLGWSAGCRLVRLACLLNTKRADGFFLCFKRREKRKPSTTTVAFGNDLGRMRIARGSKLHLTTTADDG